MSVILRSSFRTNIANIVAAVLRPAHGTRIRTEGKAFEGVRYTLPLVRSRFGDGLAGTDDWWAIDSSAEATDHRRPAADPAAHPERAANRSSAMTTADLSYESSNTSETGR